MRKIGELKMVIAGVGAMLLLLSLTPANASSANISHSYNSNNTISPGTLVSLDPNKTNYVEESNSYNGESLLGVAVAINDSLLAEDASPGSVQVATSGTANTLVSTINGPVNVGDSISVSPIDGFGMKASPGAFVVGLAQTALNSTSPSVVAHDVVNKSGETTKIYVGYVRLGISIGAGASEQGNQVSDIQQLGKYITGRDISSARVIVSFIIALVAVLSLITLIYASIYSGIISIGRNPLAKYAVFRSLSSVLVMIVLIVIIASVTVAILLK
jgi:hypothetical protein